MTFLALYSSSAHAQHAAWWKKKGQSGEHRTGFLPTEYLPLNVDACLCFAILVELLKLENFACGRFPRWPGSPSWRANIWELRCILLTVQAPHKKLSPLLDEKLDKVTPIAWKTWVSLLPVFSLLRLPWPKSNTETSISSTALICLPWLPS